MPGAESLMGGGRRIELTPALSSGKVARTGGYMMGDCRFSNFASALINLTTHSCR
jgi:hypothetical protein